MSVASSQVHYEEIQCRSAINRVKGMAFRWSLNPYRGCVHGCHYCFARRFHAHYDLDAGDDFTGIVFVKTNVAPVLREELSRPTWKREMVAVGTATDPYQPIEGKYRLTRSCLEAFVDWRSPISLVTKGSMIVRDVDLLAELARVANCTVCFSVTTLDLELTRKLEPGTPPPHQRLRAMERLVAAGVNAGVLLAPIVPGITDGASNLEDIVRSASSHGASFLWSNALYLKPGTKEHFMTFLQREFPGQHREYQRLYSGAYPPKRLRSQVQKDAADLRRTYGISGQTALHADPSQQPRQLELALR